MRTLFLLLFFSLFSCHSQAQSPAWADELLIRYDRYKENAIADRRFKHAEVAPLILKFSGKKGFEVREKGRSVEGRPVYLVKYGNGPVKVLLWSQMHGDEPTATMALLDLFNFLSASDEFDSVRSLLREELTLYFLPMLNPDGAEEYQRRNALDIDINRDALRLQTPEGRLLKAVRDEVDADWGFNLHDQSRYNSVGLSPGEATFAFLAPAFDSAKSVNETRKNAMQLIVTMNRWLQQYIPGQVARFDDTFEPRAFGDNMQRWGTRTILVECGGLDGDAEKQKIRKLHFGMLVLALDAIARKSYEAHSIQAYNDIAYNNRRLFDLIIREVRVEKGGKSFIADLGFQRNEHSYDSQRRFYYSSTISDLGDLSTHNAYEELHAGGYTALPGKTYPQTVSSLSALQQLDAASLHRQGYTDIKVSNLPKKADFDDLPFRLHAAGGRIPSNEIGLERNPSFFLVRNGVKEYVVVNGFLHRIE